MLNTQTVLLYPLGITLKVIVRKGAKVSTTMTIKGQVTILIVDHNLDLTLALSDTALVLDRGRISHQGAAMPLLKDLEFRRQKLWV